MIRLTHLNARRGSEVSRLQKTDFTERHQWIESEKENLSKEELDLLDKYTVCYIMGKGTRIIPILIPRALEKPIEILINKKKTGFVLVSIKITSSCLPIRNNLVIPSQATMKSLTYAQN